MLDPTNKFFGMTRENIIALWDVNGKDASEKGTAMHMNVSTEYGFFKKFIVDFPLKPYRTEWTVFYTKYKLCGSIDMIFENPDGTLQIYDWKRVKSIEYEAFGNKTSIIPCLKHMPDTNFWHYALQLNLYKMILEEQYDKKVTDLYLVCMHPDNFHQLFGKDNHPHHNQMHQSED